MCVKRYIREIFSAVIETWEGGGGMQSQRLFPFDMIKRGSHIVIYGFGVWGRSYAEQVQETRWCKIVGISDNEEKITDYHYIKPEEIVKTSFDYLIIAIKSLSEASSIYRRMRSFGIPEEKIIHIGKRNGTFPVDQRADEASSLTIVLKDNGGFGDALMSMVFVKKIKELAGDESRILFVSKYHLFFQRFGFVTESISSQHNIGDIEDFADVVISIMHFSFIEKFEKERVKKYSMRLYEFCVDALYTQKYVLNRNIYQIQNYARALGRNRIEEPDIHNVIGIDRNMEIDIPIFDYEETYIDEIGLTGKAYYTINRDAGDSGNKNIKVWPLKHYIELLKMIGRQYPQIVSVLVGDKADDELHPYVNVDLSGKTDLGRLSAVLKYALVHIGSEGGLIHLRHFLGGNAIVFFGPTSVESLGYNENMNLHTSVCDINCCWLTNNWTKHCLKNYDEPICLSSIIPKMAFSTFVQMVEICNNN